MAASIPRLKCTLSVIAKLKIVYCRHCLGIFTSSRQISSGALYNKNDHNKTTHFGYEEVSKDEKSKRVHEVFTNVSIKYDLMNDAMSLGVHRLWKDYFMKMLGPTPGTQLLDVAGGTGDIAFRFLDYMKYQDSLQLSWNVPPKMRNSETWPRKSPEMDDDSSSSHEELKDEVPHHVTICDINKSMLDVGQKRAVARGFIYGISWVEGNAEELPFESDSMDAYTIAFGIRNVTRVQKALDEAYRVLRPGGRFMCLEFSDVKNELIKSAYDLYSFQVIPALGQILAGDWNSYQYLVESIRQFPCQETFAYMIEEAGFSNVTVDNLSAGIAAVHSGFKL